MSKPSFPPRRPPIPATRWREARGEEERRARGAESGQNAIGVSKNARSSHQVAGGGRRRRRARGKIGESMSYGMSYGMLYGMSYGMPNCDRGV